MTRTEEKKRDKRLLARLASCLCKPKMRAILAKLEFPADLAETVLERFWDGLPMDICTVSKRRQTYALPKLERLLVNGLPDCFPLLNEREQGCVEEILRDY